jgi:flagellar biosynthesis protein FliQ
MVDFDLAATMHDTFLLAARLAAPPLLAALVVGIAVSLVQAVTQINEQTVVFLPKAAALVVALVLTGTAMQVALQDFTRALFDKLIAIGGS